MALMMSVVLILNLINSIITSQIRQIGILKAIGATTNKVMFIYLGGMAVLGLLDGVGNSNTSAVPDPSSQDTIFPSEDVGTSSTRVSQEGEAEMHSTSSVQSVPLESPQAWDRVCV